jgi:predicted RNase H-like HicB family nuclease
MYTFDVVVWPGELSDGSTCYAAWCSYVLGVGAQGDTEQEVLKSITDMMEDVISDPSPDETALADEPTAVAEMDELMRELSEEGISYQVHRVTLAVPEPADA